MTVYSVEETYTYMWHVDKNTSNRMKFWSWHINSIRLEIRFLNSISGISASIIFREIIIYHLKNNLTNKDNILLSMFNISIHNYVQQFRNCIKKTILNSNCCLLFEQVIYCNLQLIVALELLANTWASLPEATMLIWNQAFIIKITAH